MLFVIDSHACEGQTGAQRRSRSGNRVGKDGANQVIVPSV